MAALKTTLAALRCRVNIYSQVQTPDGQGGFTLSYTLADTVWAQIEVWRGKESYRADRSEALVSQRVIVRSGTTVDVESVVVYQGRKLPVKYLNQVTEGAQKYIELLCTEGDPIGWQGDLS